MGHSLWQQHLQMCSVYFAPQSYNSQKQSPFFLQSETAFYKHLPSRPIDKFLRFIYSAKVEHVCNFSAVHQLIYTTLKNVFRNLLFVVATPQEQKEAKWAHSTLHQHFPSWYWEFKPATLFLKHLGFATILMVECYQNIEFFKV